MIVYISGQIVIRLPQENREPFFTINLRKELFAVDQDLYIN